ncbi:MAG: DUF5993 family protein [Chlamydiia bacterium]
MFSLFLLFGIIQLMILFGIHTRIKTFFLITLLLSIAMLIHHATDVLGIRL